MLYFSGVLMASKVFSHMFMLFPRILLVVLSRYSGQVNIKIRLIKDR